MGEIGHNGHLPVHILVVEDSAVQAEALRRILSKEGYTVSVAKNGIEGLSITREKRPDLVITDIMMPEMNGFELCGHIKTEEKFKATPVILLTSLNDPKDVINGLKCGADNFITKPFDEKYLLSRIKYMLLSKELHVRDRTQMGVEIYFAGEKHLITSERQQILDILLSTYETAVQKNFELVKAQENLKRLNEQLEEKVKERTIALEAEVTERKRAQKRLQHLNLVLFAIRKVNQLITRESDCNRLLQGACERMVSTRGYDSAWIVLLDESKKVVSYAEAGIGEDFLPLEEQLRHSKLPICSRKALTQSGSVITQDTTASCADCPLAHRHTPRGELTSRMEHSGHIYGLVTVSGPAGMVTDKEEIELFEEVTADIALGLSNIKREEQRKKAEEAFQRSEERFRLAAKSATDLIYEWDMKERVDWFGKIDELLGYAPNEFPRTLEAWTNSVHPDDRDRVMVAIKNHLEKNEPYNIEYRIRRKDGAYNYWWGRGTAVRDDKGNPYRWIGAITDVTDRKRAEEALRISEEKYRTILESMEEGYYEVDLKGNFTFFNDSLCRMLGYIKDELMGMNNRQYMDKVTAKKTYQVFNQLYTDGGSYKTLDWEIIRKDHTRRFHESSVSLIRNAKGEKIGFRGIVRDVTDRKRSEEALLESEERFRDLFDNAPTGYFEYDIQGRITNVNRTELGMLGYTFEEMIGRPVWRFVVEEEMAHKSVLAKLAGTMPPSRGLERTYRRKDGTTFPSLVQDRLLKDPEGKIVGIRGTLQDITELKRAEEEAKRLAQENAIMAEIGRIIGSTLNIEETYEAFSTEVKKIISFDRIVINMIDTEKKTVRNVYMAGEGLRDRNVEEIYPLEGSGNAEMVRTKSTLLIQTEDFNEYQDRFPMLLSTFQAGFRSIMNVPLFSKGKIIGGLLLRSHKPYAYTNEDVRLAERVATQIAGAVANAQLYTERIQAEKERADLEEQLRQSQKMEAIGRLAGGIAHDFNNLLTVIQGYSQLSLLELKEGGLLRTNIAEIQSAAERASNLTRQLLAFSRRQIMETRVLDLNDLLRNLDKMLRRVIGEDIDLVTVFDGNLGRVKTDPGQIEQVIMNLAVNARDAMQNGGQLTIETANVELDEEYARAHAAVTPGRYVMLSVSDKGVGMPLEVRERIFEPFFTTKETGKGTGLGLSTVYGIVKQSDGNIWVYSEPGKGTTFKIYLPRVDEPLEEEKEKVETKELPHGSETVLIVEDDENVRKLAVQILTNQGYNVLEASMGSDALSLCKEHKGPIHLMITDVVMPEMDGRELTTCLMDSHPAMKVLYMSGYTDNAIVHHGILEKGTNYIQKPFTVGGLTKKVRKVLDK
jgi:two-component system cell cycle sensor histidine kinase/response regulator CckA